MITKKQKQRGRLIVIDGTDGSGKATQAELLVKRIKEEGERAKLIDFPRYYNNFFGKMIGECLIGLNGDWAKLDPKIASVLYAADRFESSEKMKEWLNDGYHVVVDRYASSNQIHQGGKISDSRKRKEFLEWLDKMEFEIFKIPRPDVIFYLDVPYEVSKKLMDNEDKNKKKSYQKGKKDAHESDPEHLRNAKNSALSLVREKNKWVRVACTKEGQLMSIDEVGEVVWTRVKKYVL